MSWPEADARPSWCHIAGMSKIPWTLLPSYVWHEVTSKTYPYTPCSSWAGLWCVQNESKNPMGSDGVGRLRCAVKQSSLRPIYSSGTSNFDAAESYGFSDRLPVVTVRPHAPVLLSSPPLTLNPRIRERARVSYIPARGPASAVTYHHSGGSHAKAGSRPLLVRHDRDDVKRCVLPCSNPHTPPALTRAMCT